MGAPLLVLTPVLLVNPRRTCVEVIPFLDSLKVTTAKAVIVYVGFALESGRVVVPTVHGKLL